MSKTATPKTGTMPTSINNKSCAQCEETFKKNQKCMNCNICRYWFCIECSHVSAKLYELLKTESTPNLPFNCDGCVRVLPKLNELGLHIERQRVLFEELDTKLKVVESSMDVKIDQRVERAFESFRDREERKCNLIIHNVPEPDCSTDNKKRDDEISLKDILHTVQSDEVEIKSFIRLGKPNESKPRLMKVTVGSVVNKHKVLGNSKLLRRKNSDGYTVHKWNNIYITPDLTKEERDINTELRKELERKKKATNNANLVIFRGKIVERKDISGQSSMTNTASSVESGGLENDNASTSNVDSASESDDICEKGGEIRYSTSESAKDSTQDNAFFNNFDNAENDNASESDYISNDGSVISDSTSESTENNRQNNIDDLDRNINPLIVNKVKCMYTNADQLQVLPKTNIDIDCISPLFNIEGYIAYPSKNTGRGVIIYAKSNFCVSPNEYMNSLYDDASWCNWVKDNKTVLIGSIYRSPSNQNSCLNIIGLLNEAARLYNNILITGDFNMRDIDWNFWTTPHSEDHYEHTFIEALRDNFLYQHIDKPTRFRENQMCRTLDLVITKDESNIDNINIDAPLGLSDHATITFDFLYSFNEYETGKSKYKYSKCDFEKFSEDFSNFDWDSSFEDKDISEMWKIFYEKI
ncbi:Hypothetical predicted protein [Mytilus galloprovincialis]|uniref:Endonuclease/exonuclease/phosphatase domain-containing protein n=1 Tax=Mytilus galloprovincialis TaxID=29158 RepID=A0A8B6DMC2_MYTGA|nr:Hypothetical predicted protein [Mytilus galloprovincialis]